MGFVDAALRCTYDNRLHAAKEPVRYGKNGGRCDCAGTHTRSTSTHCFVVAQSREGRPVRESACRSCLRVHALYCMQGVVTSEGLLVTVCDLSLWFLERRDYGTMNSVFVVRTERIVPKMGVFFLPTTEISVQIRQDTTEASNAQNSMGMTVSPGQGV